MIGLSRDAMVALREEIASLVKERDALRQALEEAKRRLQDIASGDLDYGDEPLAVCALHAHGALARIRDILGGSAREMQQTAKYSKRSRPMADWTPPEAMVEDIVVKIRGAGDMPYVRHIIRAVLAASPIGELVEAFNDIIKLCPKVLHGERDVVDIAEIAHVALARAKGETE